MSADYYVCSGKSSTKIHNAVLEGNGCNKTVIHSPCLSNLSPLKLLPLLQDQVEGHRYAIIKEIQADLQKVLNMLTRKIFKNTSNHGRSVGIDFMLL